MEIQEIEAGQQMELRRAATREQVRKHRPANSVNLGTLWQEPQSGKERSRKSHLRKKQLRQAVPPNVENRILQVERWMESSLRGGRGPEKRGPPAVFPAPPCSTAWGGVSFSAFPAAIPAEAPAPPIPQTGCC